jgi:hypothetical protein
LAEILTEIRPRVLAAIADQQHRAEIFHQVAESEALDLLRAGRRDDAGACVERILRSSGVQ